MSKLTATYSGFELIIIGLCTVLFFGLVLVGFRFLFSRMTSIFPKLPRSEEYYFSNDLLCATALYLLCTILFFFPIMVSVSEFLIGPPEDNMKYVWTMWWGYQGLFKQEYSLLFSNYIFYPEGHSLIYYDFSWYNLFLSFFLNIFFTPVTTYNLLILSSFVLSGVGCFLLIKYLVKNSYAALLGGYIFAFNPSHYSHSLHHMNISSVQFIPFFVLFFIKAVKGQSRKDLGLAAVFFLLNALCDWNYLLYMTIFMSFSYIYLMIRQRKVLLLDVLGKIALIGGITAIVLSPWLVRMVLVSIRQPGMHVRGGHGYYIVDLLGLFIPHSYHLLSGLDVIEKINMKLKGNPWEAAAYLGTANLLIILTAFKKSLRDTAKYFAGLIIYLILAMGTQINILGKNIPILLPYFFLQYVPFFSNSRAPSRNMVMVYLFLAIIVALAFKNLFIKGRRNQRIKVGLVVISLFVFFDYYSICRVKTKVFLPECYQAINKNGETFGILDLPGTWNANERYMMYQTFHHLPIVQGTTPRKVGANLGDRLALNNMVQLEKQLRTSEVKYIIFHKNLLSNKKNYTPIDQFKEQFTHVCEDEANLLLMVY